MNYELLLTAEKLLLNRAGLAENFLRLPVSVTCLFYPGILTINLHQADAISQNALFQEALPAVVFVLLLDQHFNRRDVPLYSRSSLPDFCHRFQLPRTNAEQISAFWGVQQQIQHENCDALRTLYPSVLPEKPQHDMRREPQLDAFLCATLSTLTVKKATLTSLNSSYLTLHSAAAELADQLVNSMLSRAIQVV